MITGKYSFILDGEVVCESENIVTNVGKSAIRSFLVGDTNNWAAALGVGVGTSTATATQTKLDFEVDREPIRLKTTVTPRHFISKITITGGNTATFTLLEYPKFVSGDTITISGTSVSGSTVNGTFTAGTVNVSAKTFTITKSGLTNQTDVSQESQESPYVEGQNNIVLKSRFSDELAMVIKEVGVFSSYETRYDSGYNVGIISDFSESSWGTYGSTTPFVGSKNITCTTTLKTLTDMSFSMDPYVTHDKLYLLVNNPNTTAKTVTITLYTSDIIYQSFSFSVAGSSGVQILEAEITEPITISTVSKMTVVSSTGSVDLDALSVVNFDEFGAPDKMVSRSVLPTPITKVAGKQLEVEYTMRIG